MFGQGQSQWHSVSRLLRTHWYHVTVQAKHDGRATEVVLMLDSEPRLQQILIAQDTETIVTEVLVVTPPHMNRSDGWKMESVESVTEGEDEDECIFHLIEVESGSVYHDTHQSDFRSDLLTNLRPIFLSTMIRAA